MSEVPSGQMSHLASIQCSQLDLRRSEPRRTLDHLQQSAALRGQGLPCAGGAQVFNAGEVCTNCDSQPFGSIMRLISVDTQPGASGQSNSGGRLGRVPYPTVEHIYARINQDSDS